MDITKLTRPARKLLPLKTCGAVIVAAGSATRMGGIDKVMAPLGGEPMIARTVQAFQNCDAISEIVIVTREDLILPVTGLCKDMPKVTAVERMVTASNFLPMEISSGVKPLANTDGKITNSTAPTISTITAIAP